MIFLYILLSVILFLAVGFLFLVFPSFRRHKDRQKIKGLMIAHRGLHNKDKGIPENSMEAFILAAAKGYGIETDMRLTADGEIVLFHDNTLKRMCGIDKRVDEFTLAQLQSFGLGGTDHKIPTLKEFLNMVDGRVMLVLELKCTDKDCDKLCTKVNEILSNYKGDYCIESFYPGAVKWYRIHRKDIMRGQLAMPYKGKDTLKKIAAKFMANVLSRPDFSAFDVTEVNNPFFVLQRILGAYPVGWTIKSAEELEKVKKYCDAYIFEGFEP